MKKISIKDPILDEPIGNVVSRRAVLLALSAGKQTVRPKKWWKTTKFVCSAFMAGLIFLICVQSILALMPESPHDRDYLVKYMKERNKSKPVDYEKIKKSMGITEKNTMKLNKKED